MEQVTPSDFYLTLCLYVSFYFLFFTSTAAPLPATLPTDEELSNFRRAKTFSEQLDPFLAATRRAHAARQASHIARARAKSVVGTLRDIHTHSHQNSRQHSKHRSASHSSHRHSSRGSSSLRPHNHLDHNPHYLDQNLDRSPNYRHSSQELPLTASPRRQHTRLQSLFNAPPLSTADPLPISLTASNSSSNNTLTNLGSVHPDSTQPILTQASRDRTRHYLHQHQQQNRLSGDEIDFVSQQHPSLKHWPLYPWKTPTRAPPRRFPRHNQKRYYHFQPEALFRKMLAAASPPPGQAGGSTQPPSAIPSSVPSAATLATQTGTDMTRAAIGVTMDDGSNPKNTVQPVQGQVQSPTQQTEAVPPRTQTSGGPEAFMTAMPAHVRRTEGPNSSLGYATSGANAAGRARYETTCHLEDSVTPAALLAHLRFLRMVQRLVIFDDEDLDFLYLIRSEERYLLYLDLLQRTKPPANQLPLPPLDVALMWTVHMLSPFRYHEDLIRNYSPQLLKYSFPLEQYVASLDIENPTTDHEVFAASKRLWQQYYPHESFDLDKNNTSHMFAVQCLWCGVENVMDSPTFIKFRIDNDPIECGGCESQCSLETLSSKRFWDGIGAYRADPSILLVGSLLSPWTGTPDALTAQREHHHLFFHPRIQFGLDQASFSLNCTWPKIIQAFQGMGPDQYYGIRPTTIPRIISSYRGLVDDRLSMDLVAGALRQRDFQRAMMVTGGQAWCHPDVLDRMLERYKMFMLVSRAESKHGGGAPGQHALVPTLDIDLAWHTHMLSPAHYRQYQLVHYGRVLNHDDTVQATSAMTKQDFVRTAELWHDVFHEQYSSQLSGQFLWTPGKVCASVCCPPYGAYLAWKSWRSKRKVKKMAKKQQQKREEQAKKRAQRESTLDSNVEKDQETGTQGGDHVHSNGSTVLVLEKDQQEQRASMETQEGIEDIKGKGRCVESLPMTEVSTVGAESSTSGANRATTKASDTRSIPPRSMTPALGLDGRLSNWNSDPKGLDGQALCSSGACIMSTWNEVQELSPFVELQQHQRELRTQRT